MTSCHRLLKSFQSLMYVAFSYRSCTFVVNSNLITCSSQVHGMYMCTKSGRNHHWLRWHIRGEKTNIFGPPAGGCGPLSIFMKFEVWECWISINGGAGTVFDCIWWHQWKSHKFLHIFLHKYNLSDCESVAVTDKKLSYRWQTARCWFVKLLRYGRTFWSSRAYATDG